MFRQATLRVAAAIAVAPVGGFQEATNVLPTIATSGTAISPGANKYLGTAALAGGLFLIAEPGNNRIAQVDATQNPAAITAWSTCPSCTGLVLSGTAAYATSTTGQIYYIAGVGATPVSLGFTTGTAVDGPIGTFSSLAPAAKPTLTAANYGLQYRPLANCNRPRPKCTAKGRLSGRPFFFVFARSRAW